MFDNSRPQHESESILHRYASAVLLFSITAIALVVLLVMSGVFDPKPIGTLSETLQPGVVTGQRWLTGVPDAFSAQVTADSAEREAAILYGTPEDHIAIAIGTDGYLAIWRSTSTNIDYLYPWQTWVHVQPGANEIWLDVAPDRWSIRINREVFYQGEPLAEVSGREIGVMGDVSAEISVVEIFTP